MILICIGYDYMAYMEYTDPDVCSPKNALKLNHSLSLIPWSITFPAIPQEI